MELRTLKTFQTIVQTGSFSKAAKELNYSQAAITIQIQQLEKELQTLLFERFGKNISLTPQGTCFYDYACRILQESDKAIASLKSSDESQGQLCIGLTESLCASVFPDILHEFHRAYPHIAISIETASPQELLEALNHNKIDIVYFIDQKRYHKDWIKIWEVSEDIVFVCKANHPLTKQSVIQLCDILNAPLILTEKATSYRYELEQFIIAHNMDMHPYLEIGNTDFIIRELLNDDNSISFLPSYCVEAYIKNKQLAILKPRDFSLQVWRQIVYHKNKWLSPQMEAFIKCISKKS